MPIANVFNVEGGTGSISGSDNRVYGEDLSSQLNGTRTELTISQTYQADSIALFYNGLRQSNSDFSQTSSTTITLSFAAPQNGESIIIDYNPQ